jgi:hypothetical protein
MYNSTQADLSFVLFSIALHGDRANAARSRREFRYPVICENAAAGTSKNMCRRVSSRNRLRTADAVDPVLKTGIRILLAQEIDRIEIGHRNMFLFVIEHQGTECI